MKIILGALALLSGLAYGGPSNDEIAKEVVKESVSNYKGICPCPYSTHPDGRQCGYRSAYSTKKRFSTHLLLHYRYPKHG